VPATRVELELPAAAPVHGAELVPTRVLLAAGGDRAHVDEHDRAPAVARQHGVGTEPCVLARVIEREQDRMVGQRDLVAGVERPELRERDRLVARVSSSANCLAKSSRSRP